MLRNSFDPMFTELVAVGRSRGERCENSGIQVAKEEGGPFS